MAIFPPSTVLIVPPSQNHSRSAAAALANPKLPYYPASRAVDGTVGTHARSLFGTDTLTVNLGTAQTPNIFGVFQHNVDWGRVCGLQASAGSGFGTLLLDRGAAARRPHFWLDMRGFPATAQYWRLVVNGNTKPLILGEIVVATGFAFTGSLLNPPRTALQGWQERAELEYGKVAVSASGSYTRALELTLSMTGAQMDQLEQVFDEAGGSGERVIVVPDTRRNDIYFVEWPSRKAARYERTDQDEIRVSLSLVEESGGVV